VEVAIVRSAPLSGFELRNKHRIEDALSATAGAAIDEGIVAAANGTG